MYSIAKLLSDEPKKLESFILSILKLLSTIWIAQAIFGLNIDLSKFKTQNILDSFKIDYAIYIVLLAIGVWYLLWELIIDFLMELFIILLSRIGNSEKALNRYLAITGSVKLDKGRIIDSKYNILHFTESIKNEDVDYPFILKTRANQLFSVGLVCFIVLLISKTGLSNWQFWIIIFLLANFLFVSVYQRKLHDYYLENAELIRSKYYPLGQLQKLKNVINQIEDLSANFNLEVQRKKLVLNKTNQIDYLPDLINIVPVFTNNSEMGEKIFSERKNRIINMFKDVPLGIICSNYFPKESQLHAESETLIALKGESQEDLFRGLQHLLHNVREKYYSTQFEESNKIENQ